MSTQITTEKKTSSPSPAAVTISLRGGMDFVAREVSKGWSGQSQIQFRSLVRDWFGKYQELNLANRLVSDEFRLLVNTCSDESKFALFYVLKDMKNATEATYALSILARKGPLLLAEIDKLKPNINAGENQEPKYSLEEKRLYLTPQLKLTV